MSSLKTMMRRILVMDRGTRLGRWCHPSSDAYKDTCDASLKAFWSIYDHGFHTLPVARLPVMMARSRPPIRTRCAAIRSPASWATECKTRFFFFSSSTLHHADPRLARIDTLERERRRICRRS